MSITPNISIAVKTDERRAYIKRLINDRLEQANALINRQLPRTPERIRSEDLIAAALEAYQPTGRERP